MWPKFFVAQRTHSDGFTLLELLVALAIMAALFLIVPKATAGLATLRLREATADLAETLRTARDVAIRTGQTMQVSIDTRHRSYQLDGGRTQPWPEAVESVSASQRLDIGQPDELQQFRFFADGSASGGTITLRQNLRSMRIMVDWLTGRVVTDG